MAKPKAGRVAAPTIPRSGPSEIVELSTGIKIRCWGIAWGAVRNIGDQLVRPQPPEVTLDSGRVEQNPDNPEFLRQVGEWEDKRLALIGEMTMLLSTEVESLPEGLAASEDNTWDTALTELGVTIRDGPHRYLDWLLMYAAPRAADREMLQGVCNRMSNATEEEVARLGALFPDRAERGADRDASAEGAD